MLLIWCGTGLLLLELLHLGAIFYQRGATLTVLMVYIQMSFEVCMTR